MKKLTKILGACALATALTGCASYHYESDYIKTNNYKLDVCYGYEGYDVMPFSGKDNLLVNAMYSYREKNDCAYLYFPELKCITLPMNKDLDNDEMPVYAKFYDKKNDGIVDRIDFDGDTYYRKTGSKKQFENVDKVLAEYKELFEVDKLNKEWEEKYKND